MTEKKGLIARIRSRREKKNKIAHLVAGFIILVHAYEKREEGHASYIYFMIAGLVFLSVAVLHSRIEKKAPWIDGVFFIIESGLSFLIAYDYFHLGKKALPYCYVATGIAQLVLAFVKSRKGIHHHRKLQAAAEV